MKIEYTPNHFNCASAFACIVAADTNRLLMQYRAKDSTYGFFGGSVAGCNDDGMKDGVAKRVLAETGFEFERDDFSEIHCVTKGSHQIVKFYTCTLDEEVAPTLDMSSRAALWVDVECLPEPISGFFRAPVPSLVSFIQTRPLAGRSINPITHPQPR